jgi:maltooligosyltrehalose synthase
MKCRHGSVAAFSHAVGRSLRWLRVCGQLAHGDGARAHDGRRAHDVRALQELSKTPEEFAAVIRSELAKWAQVAKAAKIEPR